MDTPPLIPGSLRLPLSGSLHDDIFVDDNDELSEIMTSSSSELPSLGHGSSEGEHRVFLIHFFAIEPEV
jgi:hypothetical protein